METFLVPNFTNFSSDFDYTFRFKKNSIVWKLMLESVEHGWKRFKKNSIVWKLWRYCSGVISSIHHSLRRTVLYGNFARKSEILSASYAYLFKKNSIVWKHLINRFIKRSLINAKFKKNSIVWKLFVFSVNLQTVFCWFKKNSIVWKRAVDEVVENIRPAAKALGEALQV